MVYQVKYRIEAEYRTKNLLKWWSLRGGFHRGQVEGILVEVADAIRYLLSMGQSVTIDGLGTFQTALTSPGFERPEQVTPGQVSVSRVYFVANSALRDRMKKTKCMRIPFKYYMPESMLTKEMKKADQEQEQTEE